VKDRWTVLEHLTRHAADANDHNLPLMYWYAAEPLAEADPERALAFGLFVRKDRPACARFHAPENRQFKGQIRVYLRSFARWENRTIPTNNSRS